MNATAILEMDLFGMPIVSVPIKKVRPKRPVSAEIVHQRALRRLQESPTPPLFKELLDFLRAPLIRDNIPSEFTSDIGNVEVGEGEEDEQQEEAADATVQVPYESWGTAWFSDASGLPWSRESLSYLQVRLFWRSMEELALHNNEQEKWSVLRWIFCPAIRKYYMYDQRLGRSHSLAVHENDEPFSFHMCCIAARMDEDEVREGVRRNIPANILKAVERAV